jgi:hypothetical protein
MIRTPLIALLAGLCLALGVAVAGAHPTGSEVLGARTNPQGSSSNADGTSGTPVNTIAPTLSTHGTVTVGTKLSCTEGTWANDPTTYRERWRRMRKLVHTGPTYRTVKADAGHKVYCYVTAINPQGHSIAALAGYVTVKR